MVGWGKGKRKAIMESDSEEDETLKRSLQGGTKRRITSWKKVMTGKQNQIVRLSVVYLCL